jgi:DNA-binding protein H-NS
MPNNTTESPAPAGGKRRAAVDLDGMTVQELTALRDAAEAKRLEKLDAERDAVLAETRAKLAELGLTLEAALQAPAAPGRKGRKDAGGNLPVKYRGPNGETWSGRGRLPKWLQAIAAEGRSREEFRV